MKYMRHIILGVTAAFCIATALPFIAAAAPSGGIGGRPANPDKSNPRTQSIFIHTIDRGGSTADAILISNNSDRTRNIELYAVDGVVTNTGAYTCRQKAESLQDSGKWIALAESALTLERGQKKTIDFTIDVPANADVGEHNACIVLADSDQVPEEKGGITVRTRQAVRVVTTIPGALKRDISIVGLRVENSGTSNVYTTTLKNEGNVSADVAITARLQSLFGRIVYENTGQYPVIADQKLDIRYQNDELPMWGGWYNVQSSIKYDKKPGSFGIGKDAELVVKESTRQRIFIQPSVLAIAVYLVLLFGIAGLAYYLYRHKANQRSVERDWKPYTVKHGDTIESIAGKHDIAWKRLAQANRIRAPYSVTDGQKIKVPTVK